MSNAYILQMVRNYNRDGFLQSLFIPQEHRGALLAILALDSELAHVHTHVTEEMLGHIRYAWWEESLTAIKEGRKPREHPVLEAIAEHQLGTEALQLAQAYRATYPGLAENAADKIVERLGSNFAGWNKAGAIIKTHRENFGTKNNFWLTFKLLFAGVWR